MNRGWRSLRPIASWAMVLVGLTLVLFAGFQLGTRGGDDLAEGPSLGRQPTHVATTAPRLPATTTVPRAPTTTSTATTIGTTTVAPAPTTEVPTTEVPTTIPATVPTTPAPPVPSTEPPPPQPPRDLTPLAVRIPGVGVESPLVPLGLNADGTLEVPSDFAVAGWYIYRPVPGEPGPSVIAGHVDSRRGPAVFYRLRDVEEGGSIEVDRADGSVAVFTVTLKEQHDKDDFPTDRVYGPTEGAELRVITCGGTFDRSIGHYNDNIIVFAVLDHIVPPPPA